MKKVFRFVFVLISLLTLFSCNLFNVDDDYGMSSEKKSSSKTTELQNNAEAGSKTSQPEKAFIKVVFEECSSRTVLPSINLENFVLKGKRNGGAEQELAKTATKSAMSGKSIEIFTGSWEFTMSADVSDGNTVIAGVTQFKDTHNVSVQSGESLLSFELKPFKSDGTEVNDGELSVTLTLAPDAKADKARAVLKPADGTGGTEFTKDYPDSGKLSQGASISFQKSNLPSGTYSLEIEFYSENENGVKIKQNSWMAIVRIEAGLKSSATVQNFNLNEVYKITYNTNGGTLGTGVHVLSYSRKSEEITLASCSRTGYVFMGWYEIENPKLANVPSAEKTSFSPQAETRNKTFHALWAENKVYVKDGGSGNGFSSTSPVSNFSDALTAIGKIKDKLESAQAFSITVCSTVNGNQSITASLTNATATELTIEGNTGNTTDSLNANGSGTTLTVGTAVPVTIKNLKISGGNAENGGGICVASGAFLTVLENAEITSNTAKDGGGISNEGTLYLGGGVISKNTATEYGGGIYTTGTVRLMEGAVIKGNKAASYGGGVYVDKKGSLSMTGNSIIGGSESGEANTAASGGGIYVASNSTTSGNAATVTFGETGASVSPSISGNSATSGGGGVCIEGVGATFNMHSGTISNNKLVGGTTGGGGLSVYLGTFNMEGGIISGNYLENPGTSILGGAVDINTNGKFNIKGTVSIPYDGESGKNDVSIRSNSITITGEITPLEDAGSVATIVPSSYTTGVQVLSEAEDSMMIRDYGKYFAISPVSGETWKIDCIMNYGVLVATRVVDSREYFEYKAGDADALKNMFSSLNSMTSEDTGNICITLQDDIDMSSSTDWMPIGFATRALALDENNPHVVFYGVFDGDGHTITISDNSSPRCYVICRDNKGIIQNLKIKSTRTISFSQANVWGPDDPATAHCEFCGFCYANDGIIRNCWNAIDCDGKGVSWTGGICSLNQGTVENCINTGKITSMWHNGSGTGAWSGTYMIVGGIAALNDAGGSGVSGVIKNCVNYGTIKGNKSADDSVSLNGVVGAIAGLSNNAGNEIVDCYWRTNCVYSNTSTGTAATDNLNWMLCKASNRYTSAVRAGTFTGNGSFATDGTLTAASADDAGRTQTLQYGTNLLTALNSFVSDNPDDGICEWKAGSSYAAIPSCFDE